MPKLKCKFILTSLFLITLPAINYGAEELIEADFLFDKNTRPYKNIIITGVNKIHKENSRCKSIDPTSAYISSSQGTKSEPVFFVTCGKGNDLFNVFFSKSDIDN